MALTPLGNPSMQASAVSGPVHDKGGQVYNAAIYGYVGNGTADDTAAVQSALNDAIANNGTLYIPNTAIGSGAAANTGIISKPLTLKPAAPGTFTNVSIEGGTGVALKWGGGAAITGTISSMSGSGVNPAVLTMSAAPTPTPVVGSAIVLGGGSQIRPATWTVVSVVGNDITLSGAVTYDTAPTTAMWWGTVSSITGGSGGTVVVLDAAPASLPTVGMLVDLNGGTTVAGGPWTIAAVSNDGLSITLDNPVTYAVAPTGIKWRGCLVNVLNWKNSHVNGLQLKTNNAAGVVAFNLDALTSYASTSDITFRNVQWKPGTGAFCIGYRAGHSYRRGLTNKSDISFLNFENCKMEGSENTALHFSMEAPNVLAWNVLGGATITGGQVLNTYGGAGIGSSVAGGSIFFYGHHTSGNAGPEFEMSVSNTLAIYGGRFEGGNTFLRIGEGGGTFPANIIVDGIEMAGYNPSSGRIFDIETSASVRLSQCHIYRTTGGSFAYGTDMVHLAGAGLYGVLSVENCQIQGNAGTGFHTVASGTWTVKIENTSVRNDGSGLTGFFTTKDLHAASHAPLGNDRLYVWGGRNPGTYLEPFNGALASNSTNITSGNVNLGALILTYFIPEFSFTASNILTSSGTTATTPLPTNFSLAVFSVASNDGSSDTLTALLGYYFSGIQIQSGGTAYVANDAVTQTATSGVGTGATFTVDAVSTGVITNIHPTAGGSGYVAGDTITVSNAHAGTNAILKVISVTAGAVTGVTGALSAASTKYGGALTSDGNTPTTIAFVRDTAYACGLVWNGTGTPSFRGLNSGAAILGTSIRGVAVARQSGLNTYPNGIPTTGFNISAPAGSGQAPYICFT